MREVLLIGLFTLGRVCSDDGHVSLMDSGCLHTTEVPQTTTTMVAFFSVTFMAW